MILVMLLLFILLLLLVILLLIVTLLIILLFWALFIDGIIARLLYVIARGPWSWLMVMAHDSWFMVHGYSDHGSWRSWVVVMAIMVMAHGHGDHGSWLMATAHGDHGSWL